MTRELRWRILTLQILVTLVLAFTAGVAFWGNNFIHNEIKTQLSEQQIVFPLANSPAMKALPAADAAAMTKYAGQTMTNGYQAQTFAQHFIAVHLKEIGGGKTYDYYSGKALAEQQTNPKQYAIDNGIALTLFRGESLRAMLLQAWAFWFAGDLALFAAIGLSIGSILVFASFLFEFLIAPKREGVVSLSKSGARVVAAS